MKSEAEICALRDRTAEMVTKLQAGLWHEIDTGTTEKIIFARELYRFILEERHNPPTAGYISIPTG